MMKRNWLLSVALISAGMTVASVFDGVSGPSSSSEFLIRPSLANLSSLSASHFRQVIEKQFSKHHFNSFAKVQPMQGDRFIQSFAAPVRNDELSKWKMSVMNASDQLPLYAPGKDPYAVKANRDALGTKLGKLFISSSGLTLNLY